jgi:hypothetical protein
VCLIGDAAQAQEPAAGSRTVEVEGIGSIVAGDRAKAEEDALNDALRSAVETVTGLNVQSETLVENFMVVQDRIYTRARGYISEYEVLDRTDEGDLIRVKVRATVKESDLVSDLEAIGIILARKNYPRLLVLLDEQVYVDEGGEQRAPETLDVAATTTALMDALQPKGFRFVDPFTVAMNTQSNAAAAALEGSAAEAINLGRSYQVDVIVLGRTVSKKGAIGPYQPRGMVSMQTVIAIQVLRADTGEIIARANDSDAQLGANPLQGAQRGIQALMGRVAPRLEEQILERWSEDVTSGTVVELIIVNDLDFAGVQHFIGLLPHYLRGFQDVNMRSFAEGMTTLEVRFTGSATDLATELSTKEWDEFTIAVAGVTMNRVRIRVTPKVER